MFNPKKYTRDFSITLTLYMATLFGARTLANNMDASGVTLIAIAIVPFIPALLASYVIIRHISTMDELQKKIQLEAFTAAALLVGLVTFALGFLEGTGIPQMSMIWVLPSMIGTWGVISCFKRWRYS